DVRGPTGDLSQSDRSVIGTHATAAEPRCDGDLAGFVRDLESALDLSDQLKLTERRIEGRAVRNGREIESSPTHLPRPLIPLRHGTVGVAPRVGGVVERPGVDERPVQKVIPRIVRVPIVIEDVADGELAHGKNQAVGGSRYRELIDASCDFPLLAAEIDHLP